MKNQKHDQSYKFASITFRAVIIGILSVAALAAVTPYNDFYVDGTYVAGNHFPIGSCFLLLIFILLLNPIVPRIPTYFPLYPYFTEKPWTPLRWITLMIYPSVIGITYILKLELSFSLWFFHILATIQFSSYYF